MTAVQPHKAWFRQDILENKETLFPRGGLAETNSVSEVVVAGRIGSVVLGPATKWKKKYTFIDIDAVCSLDGEWTLTNPTRDLQGGGVGAAQGALT